MYINFSEIFLRSIIEMYSLTQESSQTSLYGSSEKDSIFLNSMFINGIAVEFQDISSCTTNDLGKIINI